MSTEIDAQLAELMGWKRVHSDRDEGDDRKDVAWMLHYKSGVLKGQPYTHASMGDLYDRTFAKWSPSTDISAAFQVVEKMREDEWNCRIDISAPPGMKTTICEFWTGLGTVKAEATNESLPRAICEAALAAVSLI